jgi:hypothetical protein
LNALGWISGEIPEAKDRNVSLLTSVTGEQSGNEDVIADADLQYDQQRKRFAADPRVPRAQSDLVNGSLHEAKQEPI